MAKRILGKFETEFAIRETGNTSGESFTGAFQVRTRIPFKAQLTRDAIRRQMLGENAEAASPRAQNTADVFSELAVRILDAPSWWTNADNGTELVDDNVVAAIYAAAIKAEADEIAEHTKKAEEAKSDLKDSTPVLPVE